LNKVRRRGDEGKKLGELIKWQIGPHNPLKRLKTANRIFGKAWRFQAENLEMFGDSKHFPWKGLPLAPASGDGLARSGEPPQIGVSR
jgi:hypothetical protein